MEIEEIEACFEQVKHSMFLAVVALETVKASNACVSIFNGTKEGNIFNICRESVYLRCIIETRKILEHKKQDKIANLDSIIKEVDNNKKYYAEKHYQNNLEMELSWVENPYPEHEEKLRLFEEVCQETDAEEEKENFYKKIEELKSEWNKFWVDLTKSNPIKDNRDTLVHSFRRAEITMLPMNEVENLLNKIKWFVVQLEYIINDTSAHYDTLYKQSNEIAQLFWQHIQ